MNYTDQSDVRQLKLDRLMSDSQSLDSLMSDYQSLNIMSDSQSFNSIDSQLLNNLTAANQSVAI